MWPYLMRLMIYLGVAITEALACVVIAGRICVEFTFLKFLIAGCTCVVIPAVCNYLMFFKSSTFRNMTAFLKKYKSHGKTKEN